VVSNQGAPNGTGHVCITHGGLIFSRLHSRTVKPWACYADHLLKVLTKDSLPRGANKCFLPHITMFIPSAIGALHTAWSKPTTIHRSPRQVG
jgi:hypothetical protein